MENEIAKGAENKMKNEKEKEAEKQTRGELKTAKEIEKATKNDPVLSKVVSYVLNGWPKKEPQGYDPNPTWISSP